jgi:hypothetical protein
MPLFSIVVVHYQVKRSLWPAEGGWYDKSQLSDGHMYQQFAAKYGYRTVGPVPGEHF